MYHQDSRANLDLSSDVCFASHFLAHTQCRGKLYTGGNPEPPNHVDTERAIHALRKR